MAQKKVEKQTIFGKTVVEGPLLEGPSKGQKVLRLAAKDMANIKFEDG